MLDSLSRQSAQLPAMEEAKRLKRHTEAFTQDKILAAYEELLLQFAPQPSTSPVRVVAEVCRALSGILPLQAMKSLSVS